MRCRKPRREKFKGSNCGIIYEVSWPDLFRPSRHARHSAKSIGITGTSPVMTKIETGLQMTLQPSGTLSIGGAQLEYRMIGPAPDKAPTIVMLHEGLGSTALWGDFPDRLQAATSAGVFVYSRAGYGASSPVRLPRPRDYMHIEALEVLRNLLGQLDFRLGLLVGHSAG